AAEGPGGTAARPRPGLSPGGTARAGPRWCCVATDRNHRSAPLDEWADRDYPVAEDMAFQRLSWIIERSGWAVMVVLVIAALAGAFSSGFISGATTSDPSGARSEERRVGEGRSPRWAAPPNASVTR